MKDLTPQEKFNEEMIQRLERLGWFSGFERTGKMTEITVTEKGKYALALMFELFESYDYEPTNPDLESFVSVLLSMWQRSR